MPETLQEEAGAGLGGDCRLTCNQCFYNYCCQPPCCNQCSGGGQPDVCPKGICFLPCGLLGLDEGNCALKSKPPLSCSYAEMRLRERALSQWSDHRTCRTYVYVYVRIPRYQHPHPVDKPFITSTSWAINLAKSPAVQFTYM